MNFLQLLMLFIFASLATACGNKGDLKTPTQIEIDQKKAAEKKAKQENKKKEKSSKVGSEGFSGDNSVPDKQDSPPLNPLPQGEGQ